MQSEVPIKVFFLVQSYVMQHRLAVNKNQKRGTYNAFFKGERCNRNCDQITIVV